MSLQRKQYYAHPRNAFWKIMGGLLDFPPDAPYRQRTAALRRAKIALWDMLQSCERRGSLDGAILKASERLNDIDTMLKPPNTIGAVFLNGKKAGALFRRYLRLNWQQAQPPWDTLALPSTSPANAGMSLAQKYSAWEKILDYLAR